MVNVNIAIVSDAWGDAKDDAIDMYWRGRLSFLGEISWLTSVLRTSSMKTPKWLEQLDKVKGVYFKGPKCSWSHDHPYNDVWKKDEYENPEKYFLPETAQTIKEARSVKSDMYWFRREEKNEVCSDLPIQVFHYWFWRGLKHFCLIIIGSITIGLLYPEDVRLWLVSSVYESSDAKSKEKAAKEKDTSDESIQQLTYKEMQSELISMKKMCNELKSLLELSLDKTQKKTVSESNP